MLHGFKGVMTAAAAAAIGLGQWFGMTLDDGRRHRELLYGGSGRCPRTAGANSWSAVSALH